MCEDKIVIPSKLQSYVVHWYHTYLLHPCMDRTEAMIFQHLYWLDIRNAARKEGSNCDNFQLTKTSNKKYGKLPAKLSEEIQWNKICVDLIGIYVIRRNGKKENLHLKPVTMIDPIIGWFKIAQHDDKNGYLAQT